MQISIPQPSAALAAFAPQLDAVVTTTHQLEQALPQTLAAGAQVASNAAAGLNAVKAPVDAAARSAELSKTITNSSGLTRAAVLLGRIVVPVVAGVSLIQAARIASTEGGGALVHTQQGRASVLGAVGGSLLLVPTPATQLGAAVVLGTSAVNAFGGLRVLDAPATVPTHP